MNDEWCVAQSDQQNYSNSGSYYPDKRSSSPAKAIAAAGEGFHSDRLAESSSSPPRRYGVPPASSPPGQRFHLNREFSEVLERGSLEDVARLIDSTAPQPEVRLLPYCLLARPIAHRLSSSNQQCVGPVGASEEPPLRRHRDLAAPQQL